MTRDRTPHLLAHLALALAGICLACGEASLLPEVWFFLGPYLLLIWQAWRLHGRWTLPTWAANLLALVIAGGAGVWVVARANAEPEGLLDELPWPALVIPHLGPVLMALLLVRLFRPRSLGDFWLLQGLGLLQVALGCVLASGTLFGATLLAYLGVALGAVAAHERQLRQLRSSVVPTVPPRNWFGFMLRWAVAAAALAAPLFLLTPRLDIPEWDPLTQFGLQPDRVARAETGFSEEINLTREGTLEVDDSEAFRVSVADAAGQPFTRLPLDQRWRGIVLDRYEDGVWRSELNWPSGAPTYRAPAPMPLTSSSLVFTFRIPRRAGGLFLADPLIPGPEPGILPVRPLDSGRKQIPLFFEAGGTALPLSYLINQEYRYAQTCSGRISDRYPAVRLREAYLHRLIRVRTAGLEAWTIELLRTLVRRHPESPPGLARALELPRDPGWHLPPGSWATVGRLLSDHLARSGQFTYSLHNRRHAPDVDPVLDFLTNVRQGTCERYASALVLMLRSVGVPARIVKGYRGAEPLGEGLYRVRQNHAHAWAEVLVAVPGKEPLELEWLTLDPTPDSEAAGAGSAGWVRWLGQMSGQDLWQDLILGYNAHQQANLWEDLLSGRLLLRAWPVLLAGVVLVGGLWLVRRHRRARRAARVDGLAGLYARLRQLLLSHLPLEAPPDRTPAELASLARAALADRADTTILADVPVVVVERYYRARFGGQSVDEKEVHDLADRVDALEHALGRA